MLLQKSAEREHSGGAAHGDADQAEAAGEQKSVLSQVATVPSTLVSSYSMHASQFTAFVTRHTGRLHSMASVHATPTCLVWRNQLKRQRRGRELAAAMGGQNYC